MSENFIFRAYDQRELNRQMSARGTVPDIAPFIKAYAEESALCRASLPCHTGVKYGPLAAERLDIFPSRNPGQSRPGPAPVFVFFHGGYWKLLDASDSSFMAETLVNAGACVVAVNYGLAPQTSLQEIIRQCRAATAWIAANIGDYGGDPRHIHVSGSSAGGHIAAMMLAPGWQAASDMNTSAIRSASLLSGLFDLEPVQLSDVNAWLNLDAAGARFLSPLHHLPTAPLPLLVAYAPNETDEFKRQSEVYAAASAARGASAEIIIEPGTNHFDLPLKLMDPKSALTRSVLRLMGLAS